MKKAKRAYSMTRRAEKARATRQSILDSAARLYAGRSIEDFTLDEVARHAGTTVQTVLRAFESKENLLIVALHRLAEGGEPLKPTPPGDVAAAVGAIYDLYETMGDLLMQRLADERRRPAMKPALDAGRANHRAWVEDVFAPLVRSQGKAARVETLAALTAATDVYVWRKLRRDMGLHRAAAEAVVRRIIFGVTNGEESDGENSLAQLVGRREPAAEPRRRARA
jgi:AcrR family transcriptional regulator